MWLLFSSFLKQEFHTIMKNLKYLLAEAKIRLSNSSKVIVFYCPSGSLSAKFICTVLSIFLGHEQRCSDKFAEMQQTHLSGFEWSLHWMSEAKPLLKIGAAKRHLLELSCLLRDYGLNYIFFRNKTFLFFKIESWNFQHLFEKFSSFKNFLFP